MEKPNALLHYQGSGNYNCAQAILKTYALTAGITDACLDRFANFGGGRAPDGECGALFAAKAILQNPAAKQKIEEEFVRAAGSNKCREIRKGKVFSCKQCVQTAADIVFSQLNDGHILQRPTEVPNG
jgi:hypothetical protein